MAHGQMIKGPKTCSIKGTLLQLFLPQRLQDFFLAQKNGGQELCPADTPRGICIDGSHDHIHGFHDLQQQLLLRCWALEAPQPLKRNRHGFLSQRSTTLRLQGPEETRERVAILVLCLPSHCQKEESSKRRCFHYDVQVADEPGNHKSCCFSEVITGSNLKPRVSGDGRSTGPLLWFQSQKFFEQVNGQSREAISSPPYLGLCQC
mmetsp:Transcript_55616/g.121703  ORF Transcript_55616/g.121703 Transcript_55616/m.121703 type:complete len:205 (+) Transcript_55616:384-998(+)